MKASSAQTTNGGDRRVLAELEALKRAQDELREQMSSFAARADEKLTLMLAGRGFLEPAKVAELSTLSKTEIARRQEEGRFPLYVYLGPQRRVMPREWLERWMYLAVRGKEWTPAEQEAIAAGQEGLVRRREGAEEVGA